MSSYLQACISAKNKSQAEAILDSLLQKKLVAGGLITNGPSRFWWKGKIVNSNYYNISVFTKDIHKQAIIDDVKTTSTEDTPLVWFTEIETNEEMYRWIDSGLL